MTRRDPPRLVPALRRLAVLDAVGLDGLAVIMLVATVCLLSGPVSLDCRTEVVRVERTPLACVELLRPVHALLAEQTAGLPVVFLGVVCKGGLVA